MKLVFNKEKLDKTLATFYVLTKANICVFDSDFELISSYGNLPKYCQTVREDGYRHSQCLLSDKEYSKKCFKEGKSITYTCHAGVVETISPITLDGVLLGFVIFGGLRDEEEIYTSKEKVKEVCSKYGIAYDRFVNLYDDLHYFNHKQLEAYIDILKLSIKQVLSENLMTPNNALLSSQILGFIKSRFREDLSVDGICEKFGITTKTLYKIVKQHTDKTVVGYINYLRLEEAKKLLKKTSVTDTALRVGFNDYNYFIRIFKKENGITPLQYKKLN